MKIYNLITTKKEDANGIILNDLKEKTCLI